MPENRCWTWGYRANPKFLQLANAMKFLKDPVRLAILMEIRKRDMNITEIHMAFPTLHRNAVIYHLNILKCADLIEFHCDHSYSINSLSEWGVTVADAIAEFSRKIESMILTAHEDRGITCPACGHHIVEPSAQ